MVGKNEVPPRLSVTVSSREGGHAGHWCSAMTIQALLVQVITVIVKSWNQWCSKTQGIPDTWWPFWPDESLLKHHKPRGHRFRASQTWIQELALAHISWVTLGKSLTILVSHSTSAKWEQTSSSWVVRMQDDAQEVHSTTSGAQQALKHKCISSQHLFSSSLP